MKQRYLNIETSKFPYESYYLLDGHTLVTETLRRLIYDCYIRWYIYSTQLLENIVLVLRHTK